MESPTVFDKKPARIELAPGKYAWCACGRSKTQPFCDGSHRGTGIAPIPFEITEKKEYALCNCKHSQKKPFCDGSHRSL